MLQPKRVKYRKWHRGRMKGAAHTGNTVAFGDFGLQAKESAWIPARQIEAARRVMVRYLRRGGNLWIRIFPDRPVTKKPAETRMGGGKGEPDHWVAVVRRGRIMFEIGGIAEDQAKEALVQASHKLSIDVKLLTREGSQDAGRAVSVAQ
ncbi:MAG: 50S ribosomal protein L16 [Chloroflexota bacterium]